MWLACFLSQAIFELKAYIFNLNFKKCFKSADHVNFGVMFNSDNIKACFKYDLPRLFLNYLSLFVTDLEKEMKNLEELMKCKRNYFVVSLKPTIHSPPEKEKNPGEGRRNTQKMMKYFDTWCIIFVPRETWVPV